MPSWRPPPGAGGITRWRNWYTAKRTAAVHQGDEGGVQSSPHHASVHFGLMAGFWRPGLHVGSPPRGIVDETNASQRVTPAGHRPARRWRQVRHKVALLITQTGGGAGLNIHLLQSAGEGGSELYPVISVSLSGLEPARLQVGAQHLQGGVRHDVRRHHRTDRQQVRPYEVSRGRPTRPLRPWGSSGGHEPGPLLQGMASDRIGLRGHRPGDPSTGRRGGNLHQILPWQHATTWRSFSCPRAEPVVPGLTDFIIFKIWQPRGGRGRRQVVKRCAKCSGAWKCQQAMIAAMEG